MKKFKAIVVGRFINADHTIWSDDTKAYGSVKEFLKMNNDEEVRELLASSLKIEKEDLDSYLEKNDSIYEMNELLKILLILRRDLAIKGFYNLRSAETFISLLDQIDHNTKLNLHIHKEENKVKPHLHFSD